MSIQITSSNDRTRTYWTPSMERYFIDLMLEQMHRGNRTGHTFNKQAWTDMLNVFNGKFGSQYDKDVLKSRYTNLWKQYNDVKNILSQCGFSWDETQQMVVADEIVWTAYIKAHPDARSYKTKAVLNFNDLCLIYGYTVADGRYSRSSHDIDFDDELQGVNMGDRNGNLAPSNNDRPRTDWTPAMDQYFIELMLDQIVRGNKTDSTFSKQAWTDMLALFKAKFGGQFGKRVLRHRHKKLLKYYNGMKAILKQNGFLWDNAQQMIVAEDDVWDAHIKAHPHARAYKMKTLPNYDDLVMVFGTMADKGILPHPFQCQELADDASAVKTDERKGNQTNCTDRTRTYWTPPMDRYLIDLLVEQVHKRNKVGQTFITQAWINMVTTFNAKFGSCHDKDVLKNRYKHLRRLHNDIKLLLEQSGFSWDDTRDMVMAEDSVWDAYVQAHPDARSYRVKTIPSYRKLCIIFGEDMSNGRYSRLDQASDPNHMQVLPKTGEEKDEYFCDSIDPLGVEWTPSMDRHLIELMLEQVHGGNKIGETFTEQAWAHMVETFSGKFRLQLDIYILENRYIYLMKEQNDISNLLSHGGFVWDESKQMVIGDDNLWETYIKEHPDAIVFRGRLLGNYCDLCKIRGNVYEERFSCDNLMIEIDDHAQDVEIDGVTDQPKKRANAMEHYPEHISKAQKTGQEMRMALSETAVDDVTRLVNRNEDENYSTLANAINALQAVPDINDELLLDACDLLEDEKKAKTFLALDVSLRKKWLLRKLRPM